MSTVQLRAAYFPFLLVALISSAAASNLTVTPSEFDTHLNAGESKEVALGIEWSGSKPVEVDMGAEVRAENTDTRGMNFSFSPSSFKLENRRNVEMTIDTSFRLVPDNFSFTVRPEYSSGKKNSASSQTSEPEAETSGLGTETLNPVNEEKVSDSESQENRTEVGEEIKMDENSSVEDTTNISENKTRKMMYSRNLGGFMASRSIFIGAFLVLATSLYLVVRTGIHAEVRRKFD